MTGKPHRSRLARSSQTSRAASAVGRLASSGIWETVRPPISFPPAAIFRMSGSVSYWDVAQFVVLLGKHTRPEGM